MAWFAVWLLHACPPAQPLFSCQPIAWLADRQMYCHFSAWHADRQLRPLSPPASSTQLRRQLRRAVPRRRTLQHRKSRCECGPASQGVDGCPSCDPPMHCLCSSLGFHDGPLVSSPRLLPQDFCACCDDKGGKNGDKDCKKSYDKKCKPPGSECSSVNPQVTAGSCSTGLERSSDPCTFALGSSAHPAVHIIPL